MTVRLQDHSRIRIPFSDIYWSRLVFQASGYESDIEFFLINALTSDMAFIDCGANIGYWSIQVSEVIRDKRRVIAIEASPAIYKRLTENAELNNFSFSALNRVIASTSGRVVPFLTFTDRHVGSHRLDLDHKDAEQATGNAGEIDMIQSICLDDLCHDYLPDEFTGPIVVKLDVEGAEKDAILGSHRIRSKHPVLFLYEDHARDPSCENSDFLMNQTWMGNISMRWEYCAKDVDHKADRRSKAEPGFRLQLCCSRAGVILVQKTALYALMPKSASYCGAKPQAPAISASVSTFATRREPSVVK